MADGRRTPKNSPFRGLTTWGVRIGRFGIALRWNVRAGVFWRRPRLHRGRFRCLEVGPIFVQW